MSTVNPFKFIFCKVLSLRRFDCERHAQWGIFVWWMHMTGQVVGAADRWVLLLNVSSDDTQADLGHFLQLGVPGAARGAMPGLQPVQQVHHPLKNLQYNNDNVSTKDSTKKARPVSTPCSIYNNQLNLHLKVDSEASQPWFSTLQLAKIYCVSEYVYLIATTKIVSFKYYITKQFFCVTSVNNTNTMTILYYTWKTTCLTVLHTVFYSVCQHLSHCRNLLHCFLDARDLIEEDCCSEDRAFVIHQ